MTDGKLPCRICSRPTSRQIHFAGAHAPVCVGDCEEILRRGYGWKVDQESIDNGDVHRNVVWQRQQRRLRYGIGAVVIAALLLAAFALWRWVL